MSTAIYPVELEDSPNTGRLKINTTFTNLKVTADNTASLLTGIGDPIGTTNTKEMTNKTLVSDNITGTKNNIIQISRLDIKDNLFAIYADTGLTNADVDEEDIYQLHILGTNGLETYVSGGKIYIGHPEDTVINEGTQTLALATGAVTTGYTIDVNGYGLIRTGLSVGAHASLSTDTLHVSGNEVSNPIVCTLKNLGDAGTLFKLVKDDDSDYWFTKRTSDDDLLIGHRKTLDSEDNPIFFIDALANEDSLTLQTNKKFGIDNASPEYTVHVGTAPGIGIGSSSIYMNGDLSQIQNVEGSIRVVLSGVQVLDINANHNIGLAGIADEYYDVKVTGNQLITNDLVVVEGLTVSGLTSLEGGIKNNSDKFVVDTSGNTLIDGTLSVNGVTTLQNLSVVGDLTLDGAAISKFGTIQAAAASGITFKNFTGADSAWLTEEGHLHVGQGFPKSITERFAVNGDIKFINKNSDDNYFKFSQTNSANYLITGSPTTAQKPLYIQITGDTSNHKALYLQQGISNDPTALYTRLLIDNDRIAINTGDVAGNVGREVFNIYNEDYLPFTFKVSNNSSMNINAYDSSGWKYSKNTTGDHVGAVFIGLDAPLATGFFSIATAGNGSANGAITWATPGIKINQNGNVAIKKNPVDFWALDVGGTARFTDNVYSEGTIYTSGIISCNTLSVEDSAENSISTLGGLISKNSLVVNFGSGYATDIPAFKSVIPSSTGVGLAIYKGTTAISQIKAGIDLADSTPRVEMLANPDGYAYANTFKAGYYFEAGQQSQIDNSQGAPFVWCPVPYIIFTKNYSDHNLFTTAISQNIRIPNSGMYRLMWSWQLLTDNAEIDPKKITVTGQIGGTPVCTHIYYEDIGTIGGNAFIKSKKLSGTCMGLVFVTENATTELSISKSADSHVSSYLIGSVTLEFMGVAEFNAYS